ncbi:GNAT family N-acetyltransferase [Erwinia persicina]|uniref:GNAT family N-acetyltransferase n=1 Tax=Erwinia persicina TaxID=55211 RepID=UPI00177F820C|nr:GNAT family N-acetyltransferase [Erwinia persicina]MBD8216624.1 GNAT family N-acetyltransferase [Erwinia persicina]
MSKLKRVLYGWEKSDAKIYRNAYQLFGGSLNVNPDVLDFIANHENLRISYFHREKNGVITGAYPLIEEQCVGVNLWGKYPFSYDEIMLPLSPHAKILFPEKSNRLSPTHNNLLLNANYTLARKNAICIVKQQFSTKSEKNRRNEFNRFIKAGGMVRDQSVFSAEELSEIYVHLFTARFQGKVKCFDTGLLTATLTSLRHLVFGSILFVRDAPCAMDLVLHAESDNQIYFDVPNGGVDPCFSSLSPGSLLMWKNIQAARQHCETRQKEMRFSLGASDADWRYKQRWATPYKTGKVIV